jgi:hypothetical protein
MCWVIYNNGQQHHDSDKYLSGRKMQVKGIRDFKSAELCMIGDVTVQCFEVEDG